MSRTRKIHLFNCDRTYKLDSVEDWLTRTKLKLGFELSVDKHYFPLSEMLELSNKKVPQLEMDVAVFVVHAHESRLSINEANAGIGYAKIYKALLQATGDKVIIVIGGDDSYKNEDEEDKEFISRWASRKISSQFSDDFLDGRKSFIFSWNKKHREIHEAALVHFFDPSKKGQKFEYQPKRQLTPKPVTPPPVRATGPAQPTKIHSALPGSNTKERVHSSNTDVAGGNIAPQIRDQGTRPKATNSSLTGTTAEAIEPVQPSRLHGSLPGRPEMGDQSHDTNLARETRTSLIKEQGTRAKGEPSGIGKTDPKDLLVLGCNVFGKTIEDIGRVFQYIGPVLNISTETTIKKVSPVEASLHVLRAAPRYCVLVVDAATVQDAYEQLGRRAEYEDLLKTAANTVAEKVIVVICGPCALSCQDDEAILVKRVRSIFEDPDKGVVVWVKDNQVPEPDLFLELIVKPMSSIVNTQPQTSYSEDFLWPTNAAQAAANVPAYRRYDQTPRAGDMTSPETRYDRHDTCSTQYVSQSQGHIAEGQPSNGSCNHKRILPPVKPVMVQTHLRNGRISNRPEDIEYWKPSFVVPDEIARILFQRYSKTSDLYLLIYENENGHLMWRADKKKGKEWQQILQLGLDEFIVLQTRIRHGRISFERKDVLITTNLQIPNEIVYMLKRDFWSTPNAELLILSDAKGNLRSIVKDEKTTKVCRFINKTIGKPLI